MTDERAVTKTQQLGRFGSLALQKLPRGLRTGLLRFLSGPRFDICKINVFFFFSFEVSVEQPTGDDQRAFEFRSLKHKRVLPLEIQTWDLSEYGS